MGDTAFCVHCCIKVPYTVNSEQKELTVRSTQFSYEEKSAVCEKCGKAIYVPEVNDLNATVREEAYKKAFSIKSMNSSEKRMLEVLANKEKIRNSLEICTCHRLTRPKETCDDCSYLGYERMSEMRMSCDLKLKIDALDLIDFCSEEIHSFEKEIESVRKQGEWIEEIEESYLVHPVKYDEEGNPILQKYSTYKCSLCGRKESEKESYCHCGAKMTIKGEQNDE